MSDQKEIHLRIADLAPISISVMPAEEKSWREARDLVTQLWEKWSKRFPGKSSKEVLGMVALRFAQAYSLEVKAESELTTLLNGLEAELDRMLVDDVIKP